jgi:hypothetical protein
VAWIVKTKNKEVLSHEIKARLAGEDSWLKQLHDNVKKRQRKKSRKQPDKSLNLV